jgi:RND family efflux transporter MFP subunit
LATREPSVVLGLSLSVAAAVAGCGRGYAADAKGGQGPPPMPVQMETVKSVSLRDTSDYVAVLRSRRSVQVQPQVEGHVSSILVASGDEVEPGTTLLIVDPSRQKATVHSQRAASAADSAALDLARTQFARAQRLFKGGAGTRQDLDQAETALRQAQARVTSSEAATRAQAVELHYYKVTAPTGGTVGDIPVRVGDLVTQQTLLTTLDDNKMLEAYTQVPIERASTLQMGNPVEIVDAAGKVLAPSTVSFISPRADPATQMVLIKSLVDNQDERLRSWQFTRARIIWGTRDGPAVPVLAVQRRAGQAFIWVVREAPGGGGLIAEQRAVQLGPIQGQTYQVTGGLKPGERIVVSGVQKLRPGAPVAQMPAGPAPAGKPGGPG